MISAWSRNGASASSESVIAAGDVHTAEAGAQILREGGNAVDSVLAAMYAAFVAEPVLTAPFGGGFATLGGTDRKSVTYDFFADAPGRGGDPQGTAERDFQGVEVSFGVTTQVFHVGRGATAVPLMLPGLQKLHQDFGRLPAARLVEPAIELAEQGVPLSAGVAPIVKILEPIVTLTPEAQRVFAPQGTVCGVGQRFRNPQLAKFLRGLGAGEGTAGARDAFQEVFAPPAGLITSDDYLARQVVAREPIRVPVEDYEVCLNPAPSTGGLLVAFGLRLLERVRPQTWSDPETTALHLISAMAITNLARAQTLGGAPNEESAARFLSDDHVDGWREAFSRAAVDGTTQLDTTAVRDLGGTTHISVIDRDGLACGITSSNGEGCGHVVPGAGVMANNFMGEEDLHPQGFFRYPAGARLSSMMCPTVVTRDKRVHLVLGTGGSNRIRSALLQTLVHHLLRKMSAEEAVHAPRMHYEGDTLFVEDYGSASRLPAGVLDRLRKKVPDLVVFKEPNMFFGGVHAAGANGVGVGDPRRSGAVRRVEG